MGKLISNTGVLTVLRQ